MRFANLIPYLLSIAHGDIFCTNKGEGDKDTFFHETFAKCQETPPPVTSKFKHINRLKFYVTFPTCQFLDFCLSSSCDVDKPCTESISNTDSSFDNHHCHSARKSKHNSSHLMIFLFNFMIYRILFLATKRRSMSPRGLH